MLMKNHIFHRISAAFLLHMAAQRLVRSLCRNFHFRSYLFTIFSKSLLSSSSSINAIYIGSIQSLPSCLHFQNIIRFQIKYIMFLYTMQQGSLKFYFCRMLTCNCITKAAKMKGDNKKMPNQNFRNKKYPQLLFNHKHRRKSQMRDLRRLIFSHFDMIF
mgnify:FL=1